MNRLMSMFSVGLYLLVMNVSAMATVPDIDDPAVVEGFVDGLVKTLMKNNNSPSGTVAISRNGELILAKGFGFQNVGEQVPVDPYTTLFRPGSASKLFTWTAVMQQVEQGNLDLDTDVNTYLRNFKIEDTYDEPITLRHIMTHTAGFEDGALGYLIHDDPGEAVPLSESMMEYQPLRVNPPGAHTAYSNYATALAGLIVENVSGLSFNDYIQQMIFDPLGMQHSSFEEPLPDHLAESMAASYKLENGDVAEKPFEILASFAPAGALSSTSTDMVRFGQAILNGGELDGQRILASDTVDQMLSRNFSHDERLMGMALGFYEVDLNGFRVVGHGGDTIYFHSYLGIDKAHELTFFVSFGAGGGRAVRSSFAPSFYNEFFPRAESVPVPPEGFSERAGRFAGDFGFWRNNFSTIEKVMGLTSEARVTPTPDNKIILGFAGKTKQYAEIEENLFREVNPNISLVPGISPRLLAFQENDDGEVSGFVMDGLPFMSLRRLAVYETSTFNFVLLGLSFVVFLGVLMRRFFQTEAIASMAAADRSAFNAAVYASAANWLVLIIGAVVISVVGEQLFTGIPLSFKLWLLLPILASIAALYLVYKTIGVWRQHLLSGVFARIRYTIVTLSALFVCWFYFFWNILGFQYK